MYMYSNAATMFATVGDVLPATVGVDSEVLVGGGMDMGKLIRKRQAATNKNRGLAVNRSLTFPR